MRSARTLADGVADAAPFAAPLLAAWALARIPAGAEFVSALAVVPALASSIALRPGALGALAAVALAWIAGTLGFLGAWSSLFAGGEAAPHGALFAFAAPWALSAALVRAPGRAGRLPGALAAAAFAVALVATVSLEEAVGALGVVAVAAFAAYILAVPARADVDERGRLWAPALPIALAFTALAYAAHARLVTFGSHAAAAALSDAWLCPTWGCFFGDTWTALALVVPIPATLTPAVAAAIAADRARVSALWSLFAIPASITLSLPLLFELMADPTYIAPGIVSMFALFGDWGHGVMLDAGTIAPLAAVAVDRARRGVAPRRALGAVGVLGARSLVVVGHPPLVVALVASVALLAAAWFLIEPPRAAWNAFVTPLLGRRLVR